MPNFNRYVTRLYHFTDRSNLPKIREIGGLRSWASLKAGGIQVANPGGNQQSHEMDEERGLDHYVHLCLTTSHPMKYVAQNDGRLPNPTYLAISPIVLNMNGVLFTADVANKIGVEPISRASANETFDFQVLYSWTNWSDPEVQARRQRAEKYEVLVPNFISLEYIVNRQFYPELN
jgi:hypothetical protein